MDSQSGWRRCAACQALVNPNGVGGSCVAGGMHQFIGTGEYKAVWGTPPEASHEGFGCCEKCGVLYLQHIVGRCTDEGEHLVSDFSPNYSLMVGANVAHAQSRWRPCTRCQVVADTRRPGLCVAGGPHDFSGNFEYSVLIREAGVQRWWFWCNRCQGLVASTNFTNGCFDQTPHVSDGTEFMLTFGVTPPGSQEGWRICMYCLSLVYAGTSTGACFVGQQHEFGDLTYSVIMGKTPTSAQPGWRHCDKCQVIAYSGFTTGPCAAGGNHDHSASADYSVWPAALTAGQPGWLRCRKCHALTLSAVSRGVCRDGGPHDPTGSAAYCVPGGHEEGVDLDWYWCYRCQALVHGGVSSTGLCHDGAPHDVTESSVYGVPLELFPDDAEAGWRRCAVCEVLAFAGEEVPAGMCHGGGPHDFTGSAEYHLPVDLTPPSVGEAVPTGPRLTISESAESISVTGEDFPASGSVEISFIQGTTTLQRTVTADGDGGFVHVESPVLPAASGGLVIARSISEANATARLASFVPSASRDDP